MSYEELKIIQSNIPSELHLGGNIAEGDPFTYSPSVWKYLIHRFSLTSVLDVGSGLGYSSDWFFRYGLKTIAIDGLKENVEMAKYPTILCDLTKGIVKTTVDLTHCQEVVEHIEEKYIDNLMNTLCCGKVVLITHALPNQSGHHHVNCQPSNYWIEKFKIYGYKLLIEDTKRVKELARKDNAIYLMASGMVFHRCD